MDQSHDAIQKEIPSITEQANEHPSSHGGAVTTTSNHRLRLAANIQAVVDPFLGAAASSHTPTLISASPRAPHRRLNQRTAAQ